MMTQAVDPTLSIGEALRKFRAANGIPVNENERPYWSYRVGPVKVTLPNFDWRKRAVLAHDLHHMATGYSCTLKGECLMAALVALLLLGCRGILTVGALVAAISLPKLGL